MDFRLESNFLSHLFTDIEMLELGAGAASYDRIKYDCFDAEKVFRAFLNIAKGKCATKAEVKTDVEDIVKIGLLRGNIRKDQLQKTKAAGIARIEFLAARYNITLRANKRATVTLGSETLSFVRALSIFPMIASFLIKRNVHKPISKSNRYSSDELPDVMKHSGFAAMIPLTNELGTAVFTAFVAYMVDFSYVIYPNCNQSESERFREQDGHSKKAWTSLFIEESSRIKYMNDIGMTQLGVLTPLIKVANIAGVFLDRKFVLDEMVEKFSAGGKLDYGREAPSTSTSSD